MIPQRIWLARREYDQNRLVEVSLDHDIRLWSIKQDGIEVILCSHLCLRDVSFKPNDHKVYGFVATFHEVNELAKELGLDDDETFEYTKIKYDGSGWLDELDQTIHNIHYADLGAWEDDRILGIFLPQSIK